MAASQPIARSRPPAPRQQGSSSMTSTGLVHCLGNPGSPPTSPRPHTTVGIHRGLSLSSAPLARLPTTPCAQPQRCRTARPARGTPRLARALPACPLTLAGVQAFAQAGLPCSGREHRSRGVVARGPREGDTVADTDFTARRALSSTSMRPSWRLSLSSTGTLCSRMRFPELGDERASVRSPRNLTSR